LDSLHKVNLIAIGKRTDRLKGKGGGSAASRHVDQNRKMGKMIELHRRDSTLPSKGAGEGKEERRIEKTIRTEEAGFGGLKKIGGKQRNWERRQLEKRNQAGRKNRIRYNLKKANLGKCRQRRNGRPARAYMKTSKALKASLRRKARNGL